MLLISSLITALIIIFFISNKEKPTRSIYYWKTTFNLTNIEKTTLEKLKINKLYVKFFDVKRHQELDFPIPIGVLQVKSRKPNNVQIVPVVYIVNDLLKKSTATELDKLAKSMSDLIIKINKNFKTNQLTEFQIDCDWTISTKTNYFYLLNKLKNNNPNINLSATLRLHQFSNPENTGIPPVNSVSLMCYNLQNFNKYSDDNSIINLSNLKKYFVTKQSYPLTMYVALPIFSWTIVFHKSKPQGVIYNFKESDFDSLPLIKLKNNNYLVAEGFHFKGHTFPKGDELKYEKSSTENLLEISDFLHSTLKKSPKEIILFDLNERYLQTDFTPNDLENIYLRFNALSSIK